MNPASSPASPAFDAAQSKLLRSGLLLAAVGFLTGIGNYAFQILMGRHLGKDAMGEYGLMNTTLGFVGLLGLPLSIGTYAVTHYIARFRAEGQEAHLQGLLAGCRRFLFHLTLLVSVLAIVAVRPLSQFFHLRPTLMLVALCCVLAGLWGSFATALCQGLAWFKRLAFIGFLAMLLRLTFGWLATAKYPHAETAVAASGVMLLANAFLLFWRKELSWKGAAISPWNRHLAGYFVVGAACVGGTFCFAQGDLLVAQRHFSSELLRHQLDLYTSAGLLARALPMVVAPLLTVLFTSRSGHRSGRAVAEQFKLLGLYAVGLLAGAVGLLALRGFCTQLIFGRPAPEAAAMVAPLALTMIFVGLLQSLGMWALASRWKRVSLLYGVLGLAYWLALLLLGNTPPELLRVMPVAAAIAFAALFGAWLSALRAPSAEKAQLSEEGRKFEAEKQEEKAAGTAHR